MSCCRLTRSASRTITIGHLIIRCAVSISSARTAFRLYSLSLCLSRSHLSFICARELPNCPHYYHWPLFRHSVHVNSSIFNLFPHRRFQLQRFLAFPPTHAFPPSTHTLAFPSSTKRSLFHHPPSTRLSTNHQHTRHSAIRHYMMVSPRNWS